MSGKVGEIQLQGREVEVFANTDGRWSISFEGMGVGSGETLELAKASARRHFKKQEVKVSVPFKLLKRSYGGEARLVDGVADSLKADDGRKVLAEVDGKRETIESSYSRSGNVWKPDTTDLTIAQWQQVKEKQVELAAEQREIEKEWTLDLSDAVREAINEKAEREAAVA